MEYRTAFSLVSLDAGVKGQVLQRGGKERPISCSNEIMDPFLIKGDKGGLFADQQQDAAACEENTETELEKDEPLLPFLSLASMQVVVPETHYLDGPISDLGLVLAGSAPISSSVAGMEAKEISPSFLLVSSLSKEVRSMLHALGERISVQVGQGIERAIIHLSPPTLGTLQIQIQHENGMLRVHLHASHEEVFNQLQTVRDILQHDLASRPYSRVHVTISSDGEGHRRQPYWFQTEETEATPGRALSEAEQNSSSRSEWPR